MPGLVAFRRRWSVGSDDLVVPGVFLAVLHTIWVIVVTVLLCVGDFDSSPGDDWPTNVTTTTTLEPTYSLPFDANDTVGVADSVAVGEDDSVCGQRLWLQLLSSDVILAAAAAAELTLALVALRGTILDAAPRNHAQHLIYARLVVLLFEVAWIVTGVLWLSYYYNSCAVQAAKQVLLGLVICNCCVLLSIVMTVWCTFDTAGRSWVKMKRFQRSMRESEATRKYRRSGSRHRNWRQRKVMRAYQESWNHRCRLLFCCMGKSDRSRNSFADIARLLSEFFRDLDIVPSDVVAGLVLLRKYQKMERDAIIKQRKNNTYQYLCGVAVTPNTRFLALNNPSDLQDFRAVIHYMNYALAAYGWPIYVMNSSVAATLRLCPHLKPTCCCLWPCGGQHRRRSFASDDMQHTASATSFVHRSVSSLGGPDGTEVVDDNCCMCNYAILRQICASLGDVDVVYATYHVDVGETPFFVAVDYGRRVVVVSIRGTLSMQDIVTDLNAEGEPLPLEPIKEEWLGHKGMVEAAEYIRRKLKEEHILSRAFDHRKDRGTHEFGLVLVGHSLGAGTASILAILMRQEYPELKCYSYSPPGGLLSLPAVEYTKSFITSVVFGKDVVPRIGLHQLETLRADLINAIRRSRVSKWKTIANSLLCCGKCSEPREGEEVVDAAARDAAEERKRSLQDLRDLTIHPSDSNLTLTFHQPLYPPGKIIHIVRHHPKKGEQRYESRWRRVVKKGEPVYQALWIENTDLDKVLISPVMVQDHMPDKVLEALRKVLEHVGPTKPQRGLAARGAAVTTTASMVRANNSNNRLREAALSQQCGGNGTKCPLLSPGSPKAPTPPHRLLMETSFTSLSNGNSACGSVASSANIGSPLVQNPPSSLNGLLASLNLPPSLSWDYASALEEELLSAKQIAAAAGPSYVFDSPTFCNGHSARAPLASPETLSEVSSVSSKAPLPGPHTAFYSEVDRPCLDDKHDEDDDDDDDDDDNDDDDDSSSTVSNDSAGGADEDELLRPSSPTPHIQSQQLGVPYGPPPSSSSYASSLSTTTTGGHWPHTGTSPTNKRVTFDLGRTCTSKDSGCGSADGSFTPSTPGTAKSCSYGEPVFPPPPGFFDIHSYRSVPKSCGRATTTTSWSSPASTSSTLSTRPADDELVFPEDDDGENLSDQVFTNLWSIDSQGRLVANNTDIDPASGPLKPSLSSCNTLPILSSLAAAESALLKRANRLNAANCESSV